MEPTVTVVLIAGRCRERAAGALASVLGQEGIERAEVLLLDAVPAGTPPLPGADHPSVTVLPRPVRPTGGAMRADGLRRARAPVVAFLEEHARALPGWLTGIEAVFADPSVAAAGGEMHTLNPGVGISDVVSVMSFWRWMAPLSGREDVEWLTAHDAVYRRADVVGLADVEALMDCEIVLHWQLRRSGKRLVVDPRIRIGHLNEDTTRLISRGYYLWHVAFGRHWARTERWSPARRALQVAGAPWWVLRRVAQLVANAPASHRHAVLRHLPTVVVAQSAAAAGLAVGCLGLDRSAEARFTDYELDTFRAEERAHGR